MARTDWKRIVFLGGLGIVIVAGLVRLFSNDAGPVPEAMTVETEQVLDILPHETQFAVMVDIQDVYQNSKSLPAGMLPSEDDWKRLTSDFEDLGFDPLTDLKALYASITGSDSRKPSVMVAVVNYDQDQLERFLQEELDNRLTMSTYNGLTTYQSSGHNTMAFALVNGNMIIGASNEAELHHALDRWAGDAPGLSANAESMKLLSQVAHAESGWVMMRDMGAELRPEGRGDMERFARRLGRALRDAVVGFIMDDEGLEANIVLTPRSSVEAEDLASVAKGVLAGMKGMVDSDAQLRILDDVKIKASGNHVKAHFFVDYETLNALR